MFISGPSGNIEASIIVPENPIKKVAIICHPHPLYGGTMKNKVVTTLTKAFTELNYIVITFNFRGVDKSEGHFDNAKGEIDDLKAVIAWAREQYPDYHLSLAGFSFGSYIAAVVALQEPVEKLVLVAPPVNHFNFTDLKFPRKTDLIIAQGEQDEIVPAKEVFTWAEQLSPPPMMLRFASATHFFHGQLIELRTALVSALQKY